MALAKRLISTHYNTTPRRWRAQQLNTGNRDRKKMCKRLRSGSSRSAAIFFNRNPSASYHMRRIPCVGGPPVSFAHVGFEEAAHKVHPVDVSLPTVQTVFSGRYLRQSKQYLNGNNFATADSRAPWFCYQDLSLRAPFNS